MPRDMVQVQRAGQRRWKGPQLNIGRSQFNRSHGLKTTFDASYIYPIFLDEILPGDTMTMRLNGFARIFSPLDAPIMDNIELETFFFFVPNRLVWDRWEDFNGAHDAAGAQDTDYTIPVIATGVTVDHDGGTAVQDLLAHFGVPDGLATATMPNVSCLPLRGYNLIYNEWFRDQNVKGEVTLNIDNGPDSGGDYAILKSNKKHDYFTSALPYLQKGTAISVPIGGTADVWHGAANDTELSVYSSVNSQWQEMTSDQSTVDAGSSGSSSVNKLYANLAGATGVSINALRESVAIQRLLERDARGGTRYVELIKAHFGVTNPDFRLQRPEYLGGGKSFINVSPVANTSATATEDQAELRGIGTGVIQGHGWAKSFTEHGFVIGLIRARGDLTYFQGLDRMWSKSTRYDYYIPALANLGEQGILNQELWISNVLATDEAIFGYQERWAEYRMKHSKITGKMNPDAASSLSFWHLAQDFGSLPVLNTTFMNDFTPMDRVTTIDTQPDFILDMWFDYRCARPIPVYSVPALVAGRF